MKLVYSKGGKFCRSIFSSGDPEKALASGYVWVSDENYVELCNKTKFWDHGLVVPYTKTKEDIDEEERLKIRNKIAYFKNKLSQTDYQAIKYAEGVLSEREFSTIRLQRQQWRDEINRLENL